jgi:hypothetical protein
MKAAKSGPKKGLKARAAATSLEGMPPKPKTKPAKSPQQRKR